MTFLSICLLAQESGHWPNTDGMVACKLLDCQRGVDDIWVGWRLALNNHEVDES